MLLLAKIGVALGHAARWGELSAVAEQLDQRHAGESVVLGGERVEAAKYIAMLLEGRDGGQTPDELGAVPDLLLPGDNTAAWQFRFEASTSKQHPRIRRFNPWAMQEAQNLEMVMPAELQGNSLYANWLGCDFALDLESGKLRRATGGFTTSSRPCGRATGSRPIALRSACAATNFGC